MNVGQVYKLTRISYYANVITGARAEKNIGYLFEPHLKN